ncbi:isochorismatase family protein [Kocuria salsicia]|uniref:isochorismatase family protein n=1 Tax=Kocuria salsicia TaxID=664639 RepID=UPI0028D2D68C|nr:isochorismatase family protein [Kocuria salsicia]
MGSTTREEINLGAVTLAKLARAYDVPTVVSTVGVDMGVNEGTIPELLAELEGIEEIDRTGVNSWEDEDFRAAIRATGRRKIIMAGLWTEVCLTFPTLDMLREGYEVCPVIDAVGGVSTVSHESAITRMVQAGAHPTTSVALGSEFMRNWAREDADKFRAIINDYFDRSRELHGKGGNITDR